MDTKTAETISKVNHNILQPCEEGGCATGRTDEHEYDAKDCFEDCMRLFRYEEREQGECQRACGLDGT